MRICWKLVLRFRDARHRHKELIREGKHMEHKIKDMHEEADKMMVDKFGTLVDLEKLEQITVNRQLEELKDKLRLAQTQCDREVAKWEVRTRSSAPFVLLK